MGTSFVYVGEHGFWSRDWIYADWLLLLAREADSCASPLVDPYREEWRLWGLICPIGCVPGDFAPVVSAAETRDVVLELVDRVGAWLEGLGPELSRSENNMLLDHSIARLIESGKHEPSASDEIRAWAQWRRDTKGVDAAIYLNFYGLLRGLLTGKVETTAWSPIDYWKVLEQDAG